MVRRRPATTEAAGISFLLEGGGVVPVVAMTGAKVLWPSLPGMNSGARGERVVLLIYTTRHLCFDGFLTNVTVQCSLDMQAAEVARGSTEMSHLREECHGQVCDAY